MNNKAIVALVLAGVGLLFKIIGVAIPYWRRFSGKVNGLDVTVSSGLWTATACVEVPGSNEVCETVSIEDPNTVYLITRALMILGLLLMVGAIVCFLLRQLMMKDKLILNKVAGGVALAAGIMAILGAVIFATDSDSDNSQYKLHAGFALTVLTALLELAGGILMFITPVEA